MRFKSVLIVFVSALIVCMFGYQFIPRFPFGPLKITYEDADLTRNSSPQITALSNEKIYPFQKSKIGDRDIGYAREIERWPSITDCLVSGEQSKVKPDLRKFDWNKFQNQRDVEVCLWRLSHSLGTPESIKDWFLYQRQQLGCPYDRNPEHLLRNISRPQSSEDIEFNGFWPFDNCPMLVPSKGVKNRFFARLRRGYQLRIVFDADNTVMSVEFQYSSIL